MHFPPKFIDKICTCAKSPIFYMINKNSSTFIKIKKGIRQSNPLSPKFYIIMTNLLRIFINSDVNLNIIILSSFRGSYKVSQTIRVNDLIFYLQANPILEMVWARHITTSLKALEWTPSSFFHYVSISNLSR